MRESDRVRIATEEECLWQVCFLMLVESDVGYNVIICMEESLWDTRVMLCEQRASVQK